MSMCRYQLISLSFKKFQDCEYRTEHSHLSHGLSIFDHCSANIERVDKSGGVQFLQKRVVEKIFRVHLLSLGILRHVENGLYGFFGHERQPLKYRQMLLVNSLEKLLIIGFH